MYLTKLIVPMTGRKEIQMLSDCQQIHRFLCGLFGDNRKNRDLLYRTNTVGNQMHIYLYSDVPPSEIPENICLAGQRDLTDLLSGLQEGTILGFDLIAAPTKKVYQSERNKNSQRRIIRDAEERSAWLSRKGEQNGFAILRVEELAPFHCYGRHGAQKGGSMHLDGYHYQGVLQITDEAAFRKAVAQGIGSGKASGMGMLMVKRL